jgi:hypothetical protein
VSRLAARAAATAATWSEARARPRPRPAAGGPLPIAFRLDEAALSGPAHVEEAARAAVARGSAADAPLQWAVERAAAGRRDEAAAAASGVIRARGYSELLAWARDEQAGAPDVNVLPDFAADHRIYDLPAPLVMAGDAIRRKLATDHPRLGSPTPAVHAGPPLHVFSPDAVTVLETEEPTQTETFAMSIQGISESEFEDTILPLSRIPGVNALIFAGLFLASVVQPMEFLGWIGQDVYQLPRSGTPNRPENTTVLRTPGDPAGPAGAVKYMIFSDIHRDASQDAAMGIHHFGKNQLQYQRILDWCASQNYIVLENGDPEELWYVPTFGAGRQPPRDRLQDIVQRHPGVYSRLATLASQKRYFRTIGNHDSYLWEDADTRAWCQQVNFASPAGAFVIPQCKSLDDFLPPVFIGLSSFPYKDRKDMLVIHGHQFDFWNCDEHNWLGKFITNAVAVPLDALDDPLFQFRGIDRQGNVYFRFSDFVGRYEPWANWPAGPTARTWAQALEGRPLSENITKDSIMFLETLVAAVGATLNTGAGLGSFGVQTCLGHTHNPQVRPDIPYLDPLLNDWLGEQLGVDLPPGVINLRTRYLNSGTVGWWEGIVWAIEIAESGDVSLLYWATEDAEPVRMNWEVD